jgi:PEP-CTERM motif
MKTSLALIAAGMFTASLYALPDYDPFADATGSGGTSYAVGANLVGQVNAQGRTWYQAGPANAIQPHIVAGNLSYTGLPASQGNSVSFGLSGESARLNLSSPVTSGTIYYSFLMNVSSIANLPTTSTAGIFWAGFNNTPGSQASTPSVVGTRLYARTTTGGFQLGVNENSSTITSWDTTDLFSTGTTLFIVGSYTFNPSTSDDVSQLWINPTIGSATAPAATVSATGGSDLSTIASFVLFDRNAIEPSGTIDELRIATSWADVTGVPEPSSMVLAGFGALALVSWCRARRR